MAQIELLIINFYYRYIFSTHKSTVFLGKIVYYNPSSILIGRNCSVNKGVFFNISGSLVIGNNVTISANVFITSVGLDLNKLPEKHHLFQNVVIEDDVWIGAGAIVLPGTVLKRGSVIGAGSVVTGNTEEFCLYAGNPARKLRCLKNEN